MAAFTRSNPSDRSAFDAHDERVRTDPSNVLLAIDDDGEFVGTVSSFTIEGDREVSYWIAPARWGQGVASRALRAFLAIEQTRPLYGRVLFAAGVGAEVERIYRLDG
jgi:RimJ/RimL family protein N-acetyltransferase